MENEAVMQMEKACLLPLLIAGALTRTPPSYFARLSVSRADANRLFTKAGYIETALLEISLWPCLAGTGAAQEKRWSV